MYTSKTLQQGSALTSRTVHLDQTDSAKNDGGKQDNAEEKAAARHEEDGSTHLPSGQHLLVNIKHVDHNFLNSKEWLASAMLKSVNKSSR
jgi:hypothetical protein